MFLNQRYLSGNLPAGDLRAIAFKVYSNILWGKKLQKTQVFKCSSELKIEHFEHFEHYYVK